jgi:hypothetical protein
LRQQRLNAVDWDGKSDPDVAVRRPAEDRGIDADDFAAYVE